MTDGKLLRAQDIPLDMLREVRETGAVSGCADAGLFGGVGEADGRMNCARSGGRSYGRSYGRPYGHTCRHTQARGRDAGARLRCQDGALL